MTGRLLTLRKPAGLPVFPPHDDADGDCLLARLLSDQPARRDPAWPEGFEGGIAHRLDTGTSGAVAVAADPEALVALRRAFAEHRLIKRYGLVTARSVPWDDHDIDRALGHDPRRRSRMIVQRGPSTAHRGRWLEARTWFVRVGPHAFEARMSTGVMHQIRAHAAFLGIPISGDRVYGGGPTPDGLDAGTTFLLHHFGFTGPDGWSTAPVEDPTWWTGALSAEAEPATNPGP